MSPVRRFMTGSAVVGTALVASFFATGLVKDVQFARAEQKVETTRDQLAHVEDLASVFRNVGKVVEPSVVNITVNSALTTPVYQVNAGGGAASPFAADAWFANGTSFSTANTKIAAERAAAEKAASERIANARAEAEKSANEKIAA